MMEPSLWDRFELELIHVFRERTGTDPDPVILTAVLEGKHDFSIFELRDVEHAAKRAQDWTADEQMRNAIKEMVPQARRGKKFIRKGQQSTLVTELERIFLALGKRLGRRPTNKEVQNHLRPGRVITAIENGIVTWDKKNKRETSFRAIDNHLIDIRKKYPTKEFSK